MKYITELSTKELNYNRLIILNPIMNMYQKSRALEVDITPPIICPFCGSKEIAGKIELNSIYISPPHSIKILVCKDHIKLKKDPIPFPLIALSIVIPFFFYILFNYYIRNELIGLIALILAMGAGFSWMGFAAIVGKKTNKFIRKYIFFESFREGSVISVKNTDWVEEFKKHNLCSGLERDFEEDLRLLEKSELKYKRIQTILIVLGVITFVGMFVSLFLSALLYGIYTMIIEVLRIIFLVSFSILIIFNSYIYLYLINFKIKIRKSDIYFKFLK